MKRLRHGIAALVVLALGACAQLPQPPASDADRLERLLAEQEYGQALALLETLPPERMDVAAKQRKRAEVETLMADYERAALADARRKQDQDNLADAFDTLDTALRKVPGSLRIQQVHGALRERQSQRVRETDDRLLIARADALLEQAPLLEERLRVKSDGTDGAEVREQKERTRTELETLRPGLMECGQRALDNGKLERAEKCLTLARRIEKREDVAQAMAQLNDRKSGLARQARSKKQRAEGAQRRKETDQLMTQLREAIAAADLAQAQLTLSRLTGLGVQSPELTELDHALDNATHAKAEELLEQGNALYRDEKVREAKAAWEAALTLEPDNERARANIERADAVLRKLQELQQKAAPQQP